MRILKDQAIAVIIDIQEKLLPHMASNEQLMRNLTKLIDGLKLLNVPIVVTQQYTKGLGPTVTPIQDIVGQHSPIEKAAFSCCDEACFIDELSRAGKKFVIIAGIEAHVCVLQTVVDLIEKGYVPVLIEDCVSSRKESDRNVAIERMRSEGAVITTAESVLFELCRYSGTDTFKAISKLVK